MTMDGSFSPSASLEGSLLKIENHDNRSVPEKSKIGFIRRFREALNPVGAADMYTRAAGIVSKGVKVVAADLIEAGTPPEYAASQAYEIYRGASKLTHVARAFDYAEEEIHDEGGHEPVDEKADEPETPSSEFMNDYVSIVEDVSNEEALRMFGKILAGEMERPGSFSKLTMDILSKMGRREAEAFERLCSVSVGGKWQGGYQHIVPVVYGLGPDVSREQLVDNDSLAALGRYGLIYYRPDMILPVDAGVPQTKEMPCRLVIEGVSYLVANDTGHDVFWPNIKLTDEGNQLATLCRTGNAPGFHDQVIEGLDQRGCVVCLEARG